MIDWKNITLTKQDGDKIERIIERVKLENPLLTDGHALMAMSMDITACHAVACPLDLDALIDAPLPDFIHDIAGIGACLDRESGKLTKGFNPRFAQRQ